jgi:hypothetical protein
MSEASDDTLRRAFAQAPRVAADEAFVASVAGQVGVHRKRRRALHVLRVIGLVVAGLGLAAWLAPLAPPVQRLPGVGMALLDAPDRMAIAAQGGVGILHADPWLLLSLAVVVVPLAAVAWLSRRI